MTGGARKGESMFENEGNENANDPTQNQGGAEGGEGDQGEAGGKKNPGGAEMVSKAEFDKVLAEMHKYKKAAKDSEKEKTDRTTEALKAQEKWKEVADGYEKRMQELEADNSRLLNSYVSEKRFEAVRMECQKLGLRTEALSDLEMLDLEALQVETTNTGKTTILGAARFAQRLKTSKPHWFSNTKSASVNTGGNRVIDDGGEAVTIDDVLKAEKEGRKSGDLSKYYALHKKYSQQRSAKRH